MTQVRRYLIALLALAGSAWLASDRADGFSYFQYGGVNVVWAGGQATRCLSPTTFPEGSDPDLHVLAAMGLWNLVPSADFEYFYFRLDQDYPIDHFDGYSDTVAVPTSSLDPGVLAVTYLVNDGAQWFDTDILFSDLPEGVGWHFDPNPDCDMTTNPLGGNGFSFLLVATHELGHGLGLGDDPIGTEPPGTPWFIATMNPRYPTGGPVGQNNIIELHTDDRNGLRWLYPHSGPSEPPVVDLANAGYTTGPIMGQVIPVYFDPPDADPAATVTARSVIENFGTTNEVYVRQGFYLSTDDVIGTDDLYLGELRWDLAFEDAFEFDVDIDMPADIAAGDYYLGSILDDLDEVLEEYEDNNHALYCQPLTINRLVPVINQLVQEIIPCEVPYTGPTPTVTHPLNMNPITWSIDNPEPGMTIDPNSGVVSWPSPVRSEFQYVIYIRATNSTGSSTQILFLGVSEAPPQIATIGNEQAACGIPYTGPTPQITSPDCMEPIINWSLDVGPAGMTIDHDTGVVSWLDPVPSDQPYTITIRATNGVGNGMQTFTLHASGNGDLDGDFDVDLDDYDLFDVCLTGPAGGVPDGCLCADMDGDADVDLADFADVAVGFSGEILHVGACCYSDATCTDGPVEDCTTDGLYQGDGSTCATAVCDGACCFDTGFCTQWSQDNCAAAGATYMGTGTDCGSVTCPTDP
ncbi:MAG TPA: putative Ig domain-containing protein [Phycisphaerae bacterium]|nr:putative Ig domain-containing protein [Phycisphaerae bacterium]